MSTLEYDCKLVHSQACPDWQHILVPGQGRLQNLTEISWKRGRRCIHQELLLEPQRPQYPYRVVPSVYPLTRVERRLELRGIEDSVRYYLLDRIHNTLPACDDSQLHFWLRLRRCIEQEKPVTPLPQMPEEARFLTENWWQPRLGQDRRLASQIQALSQLLDQQSRIDYQRLRHFSFPPNQRQNPLYQQERILSPLEMRLRLLEQMLHQLIDSVPENWRSKLLKRKGCLLSFPGPEGHRILVHYGTGPHLLHLSTEFTNAQGYWAFSFPEEGYVVDWEMFDHYLAQPFLAISVNRLAQILRDHFLRD